MTISTRAILIVAVILNAVSIGLSEVQRRHLGQQGTEATLELRKVEQQRLAQQEVELDRTYKLINEINNRVSSLEIQMQALNAKAQTFNIAK
ncbi:hypothetical protein [Bradyrhizobium uaiense]|uniref:Uncharacterized protein n=1 Tax=Bradyrhizobium uaiense TaxID=2594946 RepID=A0A6P1BCI1_9BRAD|nr:hypothetical protein [Bradyrhizobium uaiense]NEU96216.1 hypothetical protein [Bradyrhizobium uaiense]